MSDASEAKKLLIIRILQILNEYSDENHPLTQEEIIKKLFSQKEMVTQLLVLH